MAYSPTAIYDENNLMIKDGLGIEDVKKTLSGLRDGSLEIGQNGIRPKAAVDPDIVKTFANNKQGRKAKKDYKRQVRAEQKNSVIGINQEKMQVNVTRYSLSENARTELHTALYDKSYNSEIELRDKTPEILLQQKGVKNLTMVMQISHIRENVFSEVEAQSLGFRVDSHTHYHGLGEDFYLDIIDGLDDVTEAYRGTKNAEDPARRENYFLLVSKFKDKDGNEINVPVYINQKGIVNNVFIDTNKISTVFGRDGFRDYIKRQIGKRNLVKIKRRSQTSESDALIAKHYGEESSSNSIPQKSKKSTKKRKKVDRKFLADGEGVATDTAQEAREGLQTGESTENEQERASEAQEAAEAEIESESEAETKEQEPKMSERERERGYSDKEADEARSLVENFDVLSYEKRSAIISMIRSANKNSASVSFKKHAAAMIGYWRKGLWIVADPMTSEKGFYQQFEDGSRLIVVNPNVKGDKGKSAINTAFVHELAHDVWTRAGEKTKAALYELATEGVSADEVENIRTEYKNGYQKRGLKLDEEVLREEVFANLIAKTLGNEGFLERFDITPGRMSGLKRTVKAVTRMAKCFFGKDRYLYRKCETMARALIRVMGEQTFADVAGGNFMGKYELLDDDEEVIDSTKRTFSYDELISKPDMEVTVIKANQQVKMLPNGSIDKGYILSEIRSKCESVKTNAKNPTYYVSVPDIGTNVEVVREAMLHGLIKNSTVKGKNKSKPVGHNASVTARISLELPQIMSNAIEVNTLNSRGDLNVPFSHVLLGEAAVEDASGKLEYYAVRFVVAERNDRSAILKEANVLGKLTAVNAKEIGATTVGVPQNVTVPARVRSPIKHSI